jgi:hypothetical protein
MRRLFSYLCPYVYCSTKHLKLQAGIHTAIAILSKENEDGRLNNKNRRTKVLSTKIPIDPMESFNLLAECMFKNGLIEKLDPSTILIH